MRRTTKVGMLAAAALLAVTAAGPAQGEQASGAAHRAKPEPALFVMTDISGAEFVIELTDPDEIQHARDLVSGATTERPHVMGRIVKRPAPYNPPWSFHYRPDTIDFFDYAIEVCDATIPYVEDHLDEAGSAFLPDSIWCPWSSRLVAEIP
ncbi:calmodulin-binding protein [Streptomyces sp. NPDC050636]|uniref:BP74-related protein n=1 Tax=Streptomyces sp. NPDC050636 TaxID=3154510 RepID=UPI0034180285